MNTRKAGYYWCRHLSEWAIFEWLQGAGFWLETGGKDAIYESEMQEVDETPITRNA